MQGRPEVRAFYMRAPRNMRAFHRIAVSWRPSTDRVRWTWDPRKWKKGDWGDLRRQATHVLLTSCSFPFELLASTLALPVFAAVSSLSTFSHTSGAAGG